MKRYLIVGLISLSFVFGGLAGAGEGPRWELLGSQEVNFNRDRDRIDVGKSEGKFKQIEVRVQGAPVEIRDMTVTFGSGETFSPKLRHRFDEKSKSRIIDLPGERRNIKRIDFDYQSPDRREGKAKVSVYGR